MILSFNVLPHSPLLHPDIGTDVKSVLEKTLHSIDRVTDDIYASHPDTIVLLSNQPMEYETHLVCAVHDPIRFDLSEFGNFNIKNTVQPDIQLIDQLQRTLRRNQYPITLDTHETLHFASAIPLHFVLKKNPHVQVVAIAPPQQMSSKELFDIGRCIQDVCMESNKRIVIIASGDGSHALNETSPHPFTKEGTEFDEGIKNALMNRNMSSLLNINKEIVHQASQSLYSQLCLLFGTMYGIQTKHIFIDYSAPFGVGYFVASYQ